jgi:hypothetical protein
MGDEVYSFALKNALDEIRNVCPDVVNTFIFREDGEILAQDQSISEETVAKVVDALDSLLEKKEALGGFEGVAFEGDKNRVRVSSVNGLYLVTVASKNADTKYLDTITQVLVPTILKLLEKIHPALLKSKPSESQADVGAPIPEFEETREQGTEESERKEQEEAILPDMPVNQFIVDDLKGFHAPSDTVRIDSDIMSQWEKLFKDRKIERVEIEAFNGKTVRCKVKPIKNAKHEGKGAVQIPKKMQLALEIGKGELVRAKPIFE